MVQHTFFFNNNFLKSIIFVIFYCIDFIFYYYCGHSFVTAAAGETLEAELNKNAPGCCKFISCDMSKEEDIKVKPYSLH